MVNRSKTRECAGARMLESSLSTPRREQSPVVCDEGAKIVKVMRLGIFPNLSSSEGRVDLENISAQSADMFGILSRANHEQFCAGLPPTEG